MKHKRIVAEYNRKFQKYNQSIDLLLEILKNERKIYKELTNNIANKLINENEGEELQNSEPAMKADSDDGLKVEDVDSAPTENSHAISKTEFERTIDSLKIKRSIHYQLGITMSQIMYIHAVKRDYSKAVTFKTEAEKYLLESVNHDKNHYIIAQFYQNVGDMHLRIDGAKDKDIAYEFYDKANKIFELVVGNISIDYIYSLIDVADVYLEKRQYEEAEAFYQFGKSKIEEIYGVNSIFKHRVNSSLIEIYSVKGMKDKSYE